MTESVDMSRFIEAKSDQLGADDLIGAPRTITVTRVTGNDGDQPVSIFYEGDGGKPFKPCKTIRRVLMGVWGRYANEYVGKSMTIYRDDKVTFGGLETGGIRISHMSGIDKETIVVVMKSKGKKAGVKILPLRVAKEQEAAPKPAPTPEDWVNTTIGLIRDAADMESLAILQSKRKVRIDSLAEKFPDLHALVQSAIKRRLGELDGGPADEQRGEKVDESEGSGF